ncbi:MAG: peptidoglycan DD-metalloendopeptidase family protein [Chloroflexota bacterium]
MTNLLLWLLAACATPSAVSIGRQASAGDSEPATALPASPTPLLPVATTLPPTVTATPSPTLLPPALPTPSPVPTIAPPTFANAPQPDLAQVTASSGVSLTLVLPANSGIWQYAANSFIHPLALDVHDDTAYLLDAGRVLALDWGQPTAPVVLLQPGMLIDGVTVLEPLDLSVSGEELLVLDRAGDVYAYAFASQQWTLDRYDRPMRPDSANHYFVALAGSENGRFLLDTNYNYVQQYAAAPRDRLWTLPDTRGIDLSVVNDTVYVLLQELDTRQGLLYPYQETALLGRFQPALALTQARQVVATATAVYVLDMDGQRLLALQPDTGQLLAVWQTPPETSAIWSDGSRLVLAGRDRLVFVNEPQRVAWVPGAPLLAGIQPHDPAVLAALPPLQLPIGNSLPARDLQLPGAPRHYRFGVHQGVDLYWRKGRPVTAVAPGTLIRATTTYTNPAPSEFDFWYNETHTLGYTSAAGLDFYRGRQVWIQHEGGLLSRYAHLDSIAADIITGTQVAQGQLLGTVGNSGSPSSLTPGNPDTHVHFDLWLGDHYVGQYLRPVETRDWLERLLGIADAAVSVDG